MVATNTKGRSVPSDPWIQRSCGRALLGRSRGGPPPGKLGARHDVGHTIKSSTAMAWRKDQLAASSYRQATSLRPRRAPMTGGRRRHGIRIGRKRRIRAHRSARGRAGLATAGRRGGPARPDVASRAAVPLSFPGRSRDHRCCRPSHPRHPVNPVHPPPAFRFSAPTIGRRHASRPVFERQETRWTG